ncbi:MAG: hypothetical protein ACYDFT_07750 [Thermoplasmata archaeon]
MLLCPFCGSAETDRVTLEGRRFVVFGCMFTPEVDPASSEAEMAAAIHAAHPPEGGASYFRGTCDRLHLFVAKGEGARVLLGAPATRPDRAAPAPP